MMCVLFLFTTALAAIFACSRRSCDDRPMRPLTIARGVSFRFVRVEARRVEARRVGVCGAWEDEPQFGYLSR
eukprot:30646-Pelagococcus_subviridis.AAC.2